MKITKISPNFTGYSNILASGIMSQQDGRPEVHHFFTMQLDDVGTPDLKEFKELKKMYGVYGAEADSPFLTVLFSDIGTNKVKYYLDSMRIRSGAALKKLEEKSIATGDLESFARTKTFHMRAYDFLASITRRMMNDNFGVRRNEFFPYVCNSAQNTLSRIMQSDRNATQFMYVALNGENIPFQVISKNINEKIVKTMKIFLG